MRELPRRNPNRLRGYDYSQNGAYFVTICAKDRHHLFGKIERADVGAIINRPPPIGHDNVGAIITVFIAALANRPPVTDRPIVCNRQSSIGICIETAITQISQHYPSVTVDCFVVMPNHVHMILVVNNACVPNGRDVSGGQGGNGRLIIAPTISVVIKQMKSYVTKQIGFSPWQKSFHDHIIRDEQEYNRIAEYILNNPKTWETDCFNNAGGLASPR